MWNCNCGGQSGHAPPHMLGSSALGCQVPTWTCRACGWVNCTIGNPDDCGRTVCAAPRFAAGAAQASAQLALPLGDSVAIQ